MTPQELTDWRKAKSLKRYQAAKLFDIHRVAWGRYERGERPIPAWLPYALKGYDAT
jgi:transcriptional regulator with XRE-family HTH domain